MRFGARSNEGQPEAPARTGPLSKHRIEIEESSSFLERNRVPEVVNGRASSAWGPLDPDGDWPIRPAILHGVRAQITQRTVKLVVAPDPPHHFALCELESVAMGDREVLDDLLRDRAQIAIFEPEREALPCADAADVEEIADHSIHPLHVALDPDGEVSPSI